MPRNVVISPEDAAERQKMLDAYVTLTKRASEALGAHDQQKFIEYDRAAGACVKRIKEIDGTTGMHWSA